MEKVDRHECKLLWDTIWPERMYGGALTECIEDEDGKYWANNGEYESQVNYCPFCGSKAPRQVISGRV